MEKKKIQESVAKVFFESDARGLLENEIEKSGLSKKRFAETRGWDYPMLCNVLSGRKNLQGVHLRYLKLERMSVLISVLTRVK